MLAAVALVVAALLGGAQSSPTVEPTACWKTLFMDWADGQVSETYSVACYRTAIARLNGDRLTYGSAAADLRLVLDRSVASLPRARRTPLLPITLIVPQRAQRDAGGVDSSWTKDDAWRLVLAALLTGLLLVWVVVRLRQS